MTNRDKTGKYKAFFLQAKRFTALFIAVAISMTTVAYASEGVYSNETDTGGRTVYISNDSEASSPQAVENIEGSGSSNNDNVYENDDKNLGNAVVAEDSVEDNENDIKIDDNDDTGVEIKVEEEEPISEGHPDDNRDENESAQESGYETESEEENQRVDNKDEYIEYEAEDEEKSEHESELAKGSAEEQDKEQEELDALIVVTLESSYDLAVISFDEDGNNEEVQFIRGDQSYDLLVGVSASDQYGNPVTPVFVVDGGGFDINAEYPNNQFTITYGVIHSNSNELFTRDRVVYVVMPSIQPRMGVTVIFDNNHPNALTLEGNHTRLATLSIGNINNLIQFTVGQNNMPMQPTRAGYVFKEWNMLQNGNGNTFTGTTNLLSHFPGSVTVYAQWERQEVVYTVTFHPEQGTLGSGHQNTREVRRNEGISDAWLYPSLLNRNVLWPRSAPQAVRANTTLEGWWTQPNGPLGKNNTRFASPGTPVTESLTAHQANPNWSNTPVAQNMDVYAFWVYSVTFDNNHSGTSPLIRHIPISTSPSTVGENGFLDSWAYDSLPVGMPNNPTRPGYRFAGWFNTPQPTGGTAFFYDTEVTANMTVWARWTAEPEVTFNANGGNWAGVTQPQTRVVPLKNGNIFNSPDVNMPEDPVRDKYVFVGWWYESNEQPTAFSNNTNVTDDITVYARWEPYVLVKLDANGGSLIGADQQYRRIPIGMSNRDMVAVWIRQGRIWPALNGNAVSRDGFLFAGFNTESNGTGDMFDADTQVVNGDGPILTIYAQWRTDGYHLTVSNFPNEVVPVGQSPSGATLNFVGDQINLTAGVYPGWDFLGWAYAPIPIGIAVNFISTDANYTYTKSAGDTNIIALWESQGGGITSAPNLTISNFPATVTPVGQSPVGNDVISISSQINLVSGDAKGWTFLGWAYAPVASGSVAYISNSNNYTYTKTLNATHIVAVWGNQSNDPGQPNSYDLTISHLFPPPGGISTVSPTSIVFGANVPLVANSGSTSLVFRGWAYEADVTIGQSGSIDVSSFISTNANFVYTKGAGDAHIIAVWADKTQETPLEPYTLTVTNYPAAVTPTAQTPDVFFGVAGDQVSLSAGTATGWYFRGWAYAADIIFGSSAGVGNFISINENHIYTKSQGDTHIVAVWGYQNFVHGIPDTYNLTISNYPAGLDHTGQSPIGITQFEAEDQINLVAGSATVWQSGWGRPGVFLGWAYAENLVFGPFGNINDNQMINFISTNIDHVYTMTEGDAHIVAIWDTQLLVWPDVMVDLTISNFPSDVTPIGQSPAGVTKVPAGNRVNLVAGSAADRTFLGWAYAPFTGGLVDYPQAINAGHTYILNANGNHLVAVWDVPSSSGSGSGGGSPPQITPDVPNGNDNNGNSGTGNNNGNDNNGNNGTGSNNGNDNNGNNGNESNNNGANRRPTNPDEQNTPENENVSPSEDADADNDQNPQPENVPDEEDTIPEEVDNEVNGDQITEENIFDGDGVDDLYNQREYAEDIDSAEEIDNANDDNHAYELSAAEVVGNGPDQVISGDNLVQESESSDIDIDPRNGEEEVLYNNNLFAVVTSEQVQYVISLAMDQILALPASMIVVLDNTMDAVSDVLGREEIVIITSSGYTRATATLVVLAGVLDAISDWIESTFNIVRNFLNLSPQSGLQGDLTETRSIGDMISAAVNHVAQALMG